MQFVKKILVLKRTENLLDFQKPLSALARIEIENGQAEMHFSVVNLFPTSMCDYFVLVIDQEKNLFEFALGEYPVASNHIFNKPISIQKGISIGFYAVSNFLPKLLAFASDGELSMDIDSLKKLIAERCLVKHKKDAKFDKQDAFKTEPIKNQDEQDSFLISYDDEAVATENYYELDDEIKQKLLSIKENENENVWLKDGVADIRRQEKAEKEQPLSNRIEDEASACFSKELFGKEFLKKEEYYLSMKGELDHIFSCFPNEEPLSKLFSNSRWARINYSKEKYYVVGLISIDDNKYICYGIPAPYSNEPPKELKGFCSFIPKSIFNMFGDGYWIMFQDTQSGNCIHLK